MADGVRRVTLEAMKTLELADVSRLPAELKSGETIELVDAGKVVPTVNRLAAADPTVVISFTTPIAAVIVRGSGTLPFVTLDQELIAAARGEGPPLKFPRSNPADGCGGLH